jgi:predicted transcriptional regulator
MAEAVPTWYQGWYRSHMAMTLRLDDDDDRALTELAEQLGLSKQQAVVRSIHEVRNRLAHRDRVRRAAAESLAEYDQTYEDLAK